VTNIVLTGFMAVGKTAVGKRLARRLGYDFVDTDQRIEQEAGMSVAELFARFGEEAFRSRERDAIAGLAPTRPTVIATGGGTFVEEANREALKKLGVTVCLVTSLETVLDRVSRNDARPLARGDGRDARERLTDLYEGRKAAYGKADVLVETDGLSVDQAVSRVVNMVGPYLRDRPTGSPRS
jgi:shikimate kinase